MFLLNFLFTDSAIDIISREISDEIKAVKLIVPTLIPVPPPIRKLMITPPTLITPTIRGAIYLIVGFFLLSAYESTIKLAIIIIETMHKSPIINSL
jgi:hypothetical protein